jgi:hypothetical protein
VFKRIRTIHPVLVVTSELDLYKVAGSIDSHQSSRLWRAGLVRSLRILDAAAGRVLLLGDTSTWHDPVSCLLANPDDQSVCNVRRVDSIEANRAAIDKAAAAKAGVRFRPTSQLSCPYDPCPTVIDRVLVAYDKGHMTDAYSGSLWRGLAKLLPKI